MSAVLPTIPKPYVHYPDSDGKPMADNTLQYNWIGILKWNAEAYAADNPDVFVAGDHLIYPVEGRPKLRQAPDVYVAYGRPKHDRGSYKVFEEGGIFPQVIIEVWSPNNRYVELTKKFKFYEKYGAEEYYIVYPEFPAYVEGWKREGEKLIRIPNMKGFVSPRLGFRFEVVKGDLTVYGPDGNALLRPDEIALRLRAQLEQTEAEKQRAEAEKQRAEKLAAKLRELGIDPVAM